MTCPHCEYTGWAIKGLKPRPSRRVAYVCPNCFGEVPTINVRDRDEEVKDVDGFEYAGEL